MSVICGSRTDVPATVSCVRAPGGRVLPTCKPGVSRRTSADMCNRGETDGDGGAGGGETADWGGNQDVKSAVV